jgi:transcriptional/translational regulatory protein YebC/TACO1
MQKALEEKGISVISSEAERIPNTTVEVTPEQEEDIMKLIDRIEEDDDVQAVYHNMR